MRPGVADTSRDAYRSMGPRLGTQQRTIMEFLDAHRRAYTRSELAAETGLALSAVCGRVNELRKAGAIIECARRQCRVTGMSAHSVRIAPEQISLI